MRQIAQNIELCAQFKCAMRFAMETLQCESNTGICVFVSGDSRGEGMIEVMGTSASATAEELYYIVAVYHPDKHEAFVYIETANGVRVKSFPPIAITDKLDEETADVLHSIPTARATIIDIVYPDERAKVEDMLIVFDDFSAVELFKSERFTQHVIEEFKLGEDSSHVQTMPIGVRVSLRDRDEYLVYAMKSVELGSVLALMYNPVDDRYEYVVFEDELGANLK